MSVVVTHTAMPRWTGAAWLAGTPWAWALLATTFLVVITLAGAGPPIVEWLGDTDDAVRLVSVRELIAGAPWFDTTLPRIGAPEPLVSHWSRLIDLPIAAMISALAPLLGPEHAELVTRIVWPALLFFALALVLARDVERKAGTLAGAFALVLVATSPVALAQFMPGRIDHHNAQILCAVGGLIFLARSADDARSGWVAGALLGLGLAIGYEAMALVAAALGLAVLAAVLDPGPHRAGAGVLRAAAGATAVLFVAFLATVPPERWLDVRCDALSLNLVVVAACGTAGLGGALRFGRGCVTRCALVVVGLAVGTVAYAGLEPACMAGPFGQVSPELASVWLSQVIETKSIVWLVRSYPATGLAQLAFLLVGAAAQFALWRQGRDRSTSLFVVVIPLAVLLGCWQVKLLPYACWLVAMPLAIWTARLPGRASVSAPIVRVAAVLLLSHTMLDTGLSTLLSPLQRSGANAAAADLDSGDPRRACFLTHNVRRLGELPAGLVAAEVDLGPYIAALTPHRVVAAPYHRLQAGILAADAIMRAQPDDAQRRLAALGVDYVALCADRWRPAQRTAPTPAVDPLRTRLLNGERIDFLQEMAMPPGFPIRAWKVAPLARG